MSSPEPDPTLLAAREALARALYLLEVLGGGEFWDANPDPYIRGQAYDQADALLASGVVQTPASFVAGLAGDEALVERVADLLSTSFWTLDTDTAITADLLRALAAALGGTE